MTDGTLLEISAVKMPPSAHSMARRALDPTQLQRFESVTLHRIVFMSNGLRIHGWMALPPKSESITTYPAIVFCRGGSGSRGALTAEGAMSTIGLYASWGYVCVAPNYRGCGGSEGIEEWGAGDNDDVLASLPFLFSRSDVDATRIGIIGGSRGGMMTYMILARSQAFSAAITFGAPTTINTEPHGAYIRKSMWKHMPQNAIEQDEANKRSVILWADKLSKTTPLLILHGTGDRRVAPEHSLALASVLQKLHHPYKLVLYDNADHVLAGRRKESNADIRWWMDHYVMNNASLPRTGPHGA